MWDWVKYIQTRSRLTGGKERNCLESNTRPVESELNLSCFRRKYKSLLNLQQKNVKKKLIEKNLQYVSKL